MTETLYYEDSYRSEFDARVVDVEKEKKVWRVVLDRTCFYPEGGGQPADHGWLNGIPVIDVQKEDGKIFHYLSAGPGEGNVKGKIDMNRRRDYMQQHSGQHIISGALWRVGKYKTVSVHMGAEYTTIEVDAPEIRDGDLLKIEEMANRVIEDDLPLRAVLTHDSEAGNYPLRKPCPRKGDIRLMMIGDFDCVACGGVHLDTTRKVRLVRAAAVEKIRGNTRITWMIGDRALADYREKDQIVADLKLSLGTRGDRLAGKADALQNELLEHKRKCSSLENRLAASITEELYNARLHADQANPAIITKIWTGEDHGIIKRVLKLLFKKENIVFCLVNVSAEGGKCQWNIGCSEDTQFPFDTVKKQLLPIIEGKGGGRSPLWQGTGLNPRGLDEFIKVFREM